MLRKQDEMKPAFRPEYLERFKSIRKVKSNDKIFVGSSGDMLGDWVPKEWIYSFFAKAVDHRPDVIFQLLTKNPKRYADFDFGVFKNCWCGTTVDGTLRTKDNISILVNSVGPDNIKFISFEPLIKQPKINGDDFAKLDWIIIGADSNKGADVIPKSWGEELLALASEYDIPVWIKDNYNWPFEVKEFPEIL
jgi:protein gp37